MFPNVSAFICSDYSGRHVKAVEDNVKAVEDNTTNVQCLTLGLLLLTLLATCACNAFKHWL